MFDLIGQFCIFLLVQFSHTNEGKIKTRPNDGTCETEKTNKKEISSGNISNAFGIMTERSGGMLPKAGRHIMDDFQAPFAFGLEISNQAQP